MLSVDVDNLLAAAREVADQRGVPARVLAVEMILAAAEAIKVEGGIGREALMKEIRTVLSNIADADLREELERPTAHWPVKLLAGFVNIR
jgi:hypothetical protein